ncbi:hypothetical protein PMIN06_005585 [Paraphaeosphaeria minitans]
MTEPMYTPLPHAASPSHMPLITAATADLTLFLLFSVLRQLNPSFIKVRSGQFKKGVDFRHDPHGQTLGILGMGCIGRTVKARLDPFGLKTVYHNRNHLTTDLAGSANYVSFDQLLAESDIISVHIPLSAKTKHLTWAKEIAKMKPGVVLVKAARGAIIYEAGILPSPEECIFGSEQHPNAAQPQSNGIGELPDHNIAKELLMTYFRTWHPLVPFLHGPSCLEELEKLYVGQQDPGGRVRKPRTLAWAVIFQFLFNIAKLERTDLPPLATTSFRSEEQLLIALSSLSLKCDLESIQGLLMAQLYFVATMHLQAASSAGGLVLRSIYKSGLHRCPVRYSTFGVDEIDMRKRIFWSAYTLDRFTSQSLGHPLGIQDSDVDVCQPGLAELHEPVYPVENFEAGTSSEETLLHLPANHPQRLSGSAQMDNADTTQTGAQEYMATDEANEQLDPGSPVENTNTGSTSQGRHQNQSVQAQFVRYSKLVGRVLETFHKSIHFRSASAREVLFLKADIDAWGNMLPHPSSSLPQPVPSGNASLRPSSFNQDVFFEVARQHLILLVNRPSLSLKATSAQFRHAIQICIAASRSVIRVLEPYLTRGSLFWPGYLSVVWMAGLIIVFACKSRLHSISNATRAIL